MARVTPPGRKQLRAAHLISVEAHVMDGTEIRAIVTAGVHPAVGRVVALEMTDAEVREFLTRLAMHPHWAAAIRAAAQHPAVRQAADGVIQVNSYGKRVSLSRAMELAMETLADDLDP